MSIRQAEFVCPVPIVIGIASWFEAVFQHRVNKEAQSFTELTNSSFLTLNLNLVVFFRYLHIGHLAGKVDEYFVGRSEVKLIVGNLINNILTAHSREQKLAS
jgi:hypothetical protein